MKKFFWMTLMIFVFGQIRGDEKSYDFDLYTLDEVLYSAGKELKKNDTKILVADFFSIHCEPCRKALPVWEATYRKYSEKGLKFVVVVLPVEEDRSAELKKIKEFFQKGNFSFPVVFDKYSITGKKFGVVDSSGSASIPMIFMLDKSGKTVFNSEKHAEFIKKIEETLNTEKVATDSL
jgi:thiol-disulfide isomerase/thioredoxin